MNDSELLAAVVEGQIGALRTLHERRSDVVDAVSASTQAAKVMTNAKGAAIGLMPCETHFPPQGSKGGKSFELF